MNSEFSIPYNISLHEKKITEYFGDRENVYVESRDDRFVGYKFYFVCFMNRSGSNFLAELVASDKRYCKALENLNAHPVISNSEEHGHTRFVDYLHWLVSRFATDEKVFGVKVSWDQLYFLTKIGVISNCFSNAKFLHIVREDVISQAVSFSIASQTKQWTSEQKASLAIENVTYDSEAIESSILGINNSNAKFNLFFDTYKPEKLSISYEELSRNKENELRAVYDFLNYFELDTHNFSLESSIRKQSNELNERFVNKFSSSKKLWDYPVAS